MLIPPLPFPVNEEEYIFDFFYFAVLPSSLSNQVTNQSLLQSHD